MSEFLEKYGPVALIAGGSEGVGAAYASMLAERGLDLVLVARSADKLEALRSELAQQYPDRRITTIAADLTALGTPELLAERTAGLEIGMLIYNAGANWRNADFLDSDMAYASQLTALNAITPMTLCHHFGALMRERGRGGIILISSLAYMVGKPRTAIYSAAKAFSTTFGEAFWFEMKQHGVDVLTHALGSVDTPFIQRNHPHAYGKGDKPETVARAALESLGNGPVLRAGEGDQFYRVLSGMSRAEAVETMFRAGEMYAD
jgi:short-subunit dehydrogenase